MNKILRKIMIGIMSLMISVLVFPDSELTQVYAVTDYSGEVIIEDFAILDSNGVPLSVDNPARYLYTYQLQVSWSLSPTAQPLHAGDTLTIPLPQNNQAGSWSATDSALENLYDTTGIIVGQWQILNNKISITLDEDVEGLTSIRAEFLTGANGLKNGTPNGGIQNVSMGNQVREINFLANSLRPLAGVDFKYASSVSNSKALWGVVINNQGGIEITSDIPGTAFTIRQDVYFEDEIIEGGTFSGDLDIYGYVFFPLDLDYANGGGDASSGAYSFKITSLFTVVDPIAGETYEQYKARLQPLQGGVYRVDGQNDQVVINFGDIGDNGITYSSVNPTFAVSATNAAISRGYYPEEARQDLIDYFNQTYGNSNVIGGNMVRYAVFFSTEYDYVLEDTIKNNVAKVTMDGSTQVYSAKATLEGNLSTTIVSKDVAVVFLIDEETEELLPNGQFQLQYNNNGAWETYTPAGVITTNGEGKATTSVLGNGTYRFVEISPSTNEYNLRRSQGFDSTVGTVVSEEFVISSDLTEGIKVVVSNIKYRFDVTYTQGEYGDFEDVVFEQVLINTETPLFMDEPVGLEGYTFIGWSPQVADTVTQDIVYVAQWFKQPLVAKPIVTPPPAYIPPNTADKCN